LTNEHATFPSEKREQPVYFYFPVTVQDAIRINLPKEIAVEAAPDGAKYSMQEFGVYNFTSTAAPNYFTTIRNFYFNGVVVVPNEYASLRTFYSQFESKDKESVVLKPATAATASEPATK
jgi:hypothetical protein